MSLLRLGEKRQDMFSERTVEGKTSLLMKAPGLVERLCEMPVLFYRSLDLQLVKPALYI